MSVAKCSEALRSLLPPGRLFNRVMGTVLTSIFDGFAVECNRVEIQVDDYLREAFPDTCTLAGGGLEAWERTVGIPDECMALAPTESERRTNMLFRLADSGGASIDHFEQRADTLGYPGTFITENTGVAPFMADISMTDIDAIGDDVYGENFTWIVNFPIGSTGTSEVQCDFERNKPAHTQVFFNILTGDPILLEDDSYLLDELGFPIEGE